MDSHSALVTGRRYLPICLCNVNAWSSQMVKDNPFGLDETDYPNGKFTD